MKLRIIALCFGLLAVLSAAAATYTPAEIPDVHRSDRRMFVANPDGILSAEAVGRLNAILSRMRAELTVEPMIVVVDNITDPDDPSQFATDLFELWGLGKADKDNGLLILMVKDLRKVTIRPGYGLEGTLPDITCGRIIREIIAPAAADGNYGEGLISAADVLSEILSNPEVADEYRSAQSDADADTDDIDAFHFYVAFSCIAAVILLVIFLLRLAALRGKSDYDKYLALQGLKPLYLIVGVGCIGIPLVATIPLLICLNHWRNHMRRCPNCSAKMNKVDEVHDNDYLTPAQDLEERLGSVDYDVWLCPDCGETDVLAYTLPSSTYTECENCHARTARPVGYRVITRPTPTRPGRGIKEYECLNCRHRMQRPFDIAPDASDVAAAAAAGAILGGMGRGGSGFGGGSFGGGFGGGHTGGGGATGGW